MACELCIETGGVLLWRNAACRVVLVQDSEYPGYCRVILNAHVSEMTDLAYDERMRLMEVVFTVEAALRAAMNPHKVNLASLGNMTPHLHWHVIPRFASDPHFPHPIWATRQRESALTPPAELQSRLAAALAERLS
jgi:diadenosine tetraphosphate (Ap4A) HIT family hydrolase